MIRGGYKIIDLKNKPFRNEVGIVYEGIYDSIEECQKPILLSGINLNGYEKGDFFCDYTTEGTTYIFYFRKNNDESVTMTIQDTDVVTMTFAE